jgi:hypothetical protein
VAGRIDVDLDGLHDRSEGGLDRGGVVGAGEGEPEVSVAVGDGVDALSDRHRDLDVVDMGDRPGGVEAMHGHQPTGGRDREHQGTDCPGTGTVHPSTDGGPEEQMLEARPEETEAEGPATAPTDRSGGELDEHRDAVADPNLGMHRPRHQPEGAGGLGDELGLT